MAFIFITLFVIASGFFGILYTNIINSKLTTLTHETAPLLETVNTMAILVWKMNNGVLQYTQEETLSNLEKIQNNFEELSQEFNEAGIKAHALTKDETILANLDSTINQKNEFENTAIELMLNKRNLVKAETEEEKTNFKDEVFTVTKKLQSQATSVSNILEQIAIRAAIFNTQADTESFSAVKQTTAILTIMTLISVCLAMLIGFLLARSIVDPLNKLSDAASTISKGNFDIEIPVEDSADEIVKLTNTFNQMTKSVKMMVEESPRMKRFLNIIPATEGTLETQPKYELDLRKSYLIKTKETSKAFDIFVDKVTHGYEGLCFSRMNPDEIKEKYGLEKTAMVWLADTKEKKFMTAVDIATIEKIIKEFIAKSKRSIILIDRIDYLIAKHGFEQVLKLFLKVNDLIMNAESLCLIPLDPDVIATRELAYLEKELVDLPKPVLQPTLEYELHQILKFIKIRRSMNLPITFKDISKEFHITAPTTQKKINDLLKRNLITIMKSGRNKLLELTLEARRFV